MEGIKYKYAITEKNKLISIDKVNEKNRSSTFICPGCKSILRPRVGSKRIHHFYHLIYSSSNNCNFETYLHNASKNALFDILNYAKENNIPYFINLYKSFIFIDEKNNVLL